MDIGQFLRLILVMMMILDVSESFEFSPPSITADPLTINQLSTYQITIDRAYTQDLVETQWSSQPVISGSNITIHFPIQYNLTNNNISILQPITIQNVIIDGQAITNYIFVIVNQSTLIIKDSIRRDLFINSVIVTLLNVLNPSPALTTGTFTVKIGDDFSSLQGNSNSIITLSPQQFIQCGIGFSPSITNTTGDMILTITPNTDIELGGSLVVYFPVNLQWTDDISANHQLNLDSVNTCGVQSTQVQSVTCVGSRATHSIRIQFVNSNNNNTNNATSQNIPSTISKQFKLTIPGLFSPPTSTPPDIVRISSFTSSSYGLDTSSTTVTNLQPQYIPLIIQPSSNPLYVDTLTTLSFNFTNTDTIARDDYFQITFPNPTTINYVRTISSFPFSSVTYNSTTLTLRFMQSFSSTNTNMNTLNYIKFLNYRSPLTTKETNDIVLTVYNSAGRKKMQGRNRVKATQRVYNILTQSALYRGINDITNYELTFNISNTLTPKAMIQIILPVQLAVISTINVCPSLTIANTTTNTTTNTSPSTSCVVNIAKRPQHIIVKSLFTNTPSITQYKLTIPSLVNPGYSMNLSQFRMYLYYNQSQQYLVAEYSSIVSNNFTIWGKGLDQSLVSVQLSNYQVGRQNVSINVMFQTGNPITNNGYVQLALPAKGKFFPGSNFACILNFMDVSTLLNCTYDIQKRIVLVSLPTSIPLGSVLNVSVSDCFTNPPNTRPIQFINITTLTSTLNLVQYLGSPFVIDNFQPIKLKSQSLIKGSQKNSQITQWILQVQMVQQIDESLSKIQLIVYYQNGDLKAFDNLTQIELFIEGKNLTVQPLFEVVTAQSGINNNNNNSSNNNISNKALVVTLPQEAINESSFSLKLLNITNPSTFSPYNNYKLSIHTKDNYLYSQQQSTSITPNTIPSLFQSVRYNFSNKVIGEYTNLTITIKSRQDNAMVIDQFVAGNLRQYMRNDNNDTNTSSKVISCQDSAIYTCSLINSTTTSNTSIAITLIPTTNTSTTITNFPNPFTFTLYNLFIRQQLNFTPTIVSSYSQSYKASSFTQIEFGLLCTLPCKQCVSEVQLQSCTSCFNQTEYKWLFNQSCLQHCPQGYYGQHIVAGNNNNNSATISSQYEYLSSQYEYQCTKCRQQCLACDIVDSNCTACNTSSIDNKYLYNFTCIKQCPNTTYLTIAQQLNNNNITTQSLVCTPCVPPCLTCTNQTICTSCVPNYFLYLNQCVSSCPQNTIITNTTTNTCDNCSIGCSTCMDTRQKCLSCYQKVDNISYYHLQQQYKCVTACPIDKLIDVSNTKCVSSCLYPCGNCSVVQNNCTSCVSPYYLSAMQQNKCVTQCQQLSYPNLISNKCMLCSSIKQLNCMNCSSSTQCLQCDKNTVYVFYGANSSCISIIPAGYVNISGIAVKCDASCKQCSVSITNCTKCNQGLYLYDHECIGACPINFVGINSICVLCNQTCVECSVTQSNCTKCSIDKYFVNYTNSNNSNNNTYNSSSPLSLIQNKCVTACPDGYYPSNDNITQPNNNRQCIRCQPPCSKCVNSTYCLLCLNQSQYVYNGVCYQQCPLYYVGNTQTMICEQCKQPCLQCINNTQQCTNCINGYFIYSRQKKCYLPEECPQNVSIANFISNKCQQCTAPCLTCVNSLTQCMTCIEGSYLWQSNSTCLSVCPVGYYGNNTANKCKQCPQQCTQCVQQDNCTQCASPYKYFNHQCVSQCPSTHSVIINNTCTGCRISCKNCSSTDYCYECNTQTILLNGECIKQCPVNYTLYYNSTQQKSYCLTAQQMGNVLIQNTLKSQPLSISSIIPLPFTIISSLIFITGALMSSIQTQHTYLIGWAYVVFGIAEVSNLGYFFYVFYLLRQQYSAQMLYQDSQLNYDLFVKLIIGCLGLIVVLNLVSLLCGSCYMLADQQFKKWMGINYSNSDENDNNNNDNNNNNNDNSNKKQKNTSLKHTNKSSNNKVMNQSLSSINQQQTALQQQQTNKQENKHNYQVQNLCCQPITAFLITSLLSLIITFKLRLILFTRLFDLYYFKARLEHVQKFRFFNVLTLVGFLYQGVGIYIMYKQLTVYEKRLINTGLFLTTVDCLVMLCINVLVGVLSVIKGQGFFNQSKQEKDKLFSKKQYNINHKGQQSQQQNYAVVQQSTKRNLNDNNNPTNKRIGFIKSNNKVANIIDQQQQPNILRSTLPIRSNKKSVVTGKIINTQQNFSNKKGQKQPQLSYTKKTTSYINTNKLLTNNKKQLPHQYDQLINKNNVKSSPTIMNNNKNKVKNNQSHLLNHNIQSPKSKINSQNQLLFSPTQKTQNWYPKIQQTHLKPSLLTQIDMIQLYNPKFEQFNQKLKKSKKSSNQIKTSEQLKLASNKKLLSNHQQSPLKLKLSKISQIHQFDPSDQINEQKQSQRHQNYFNQTFQEAKIFTSNHQKDQVQQNDNSIFKTKQKIQHQHELSYQNILPFIHNQETKEFVRRKNTKTKESRRRRKNKNNLHKDKIQDNNQMRNIFDHAEDQHHSSTPEDESYDQVGKQQVPDSNQRNYRSFGH